MIPHQELSWAKFKLKGGTVGVCYLIRGAANDPIIYLRLTFGLHHEACKCVYLLILVSEAPTNKK